MYNIVLYLLLAKGLGVIFGFHGVFAGFSKKNSSLSVTRRWGTYMYQIEIFEMIVSNLSTRSLKKLLTMTAKCIRVRPSLEHTGIQTSMLSMKESTGRIILKYAKPTFFRIYNEMESNPEVYWMVPDILNAFTRVYCKVTTRMAWN
jgi:hypothetical protein